MNTYSSTILKYFNDHCPKAMGMVLDNHPQDKEPFQAGIAAHAVLQEVALKGAVEMPDVLTVAAATVETLISEGREFQSRHEPPMRPESAFSGSDIAVEYLMWHPLPEDIVFAEVGYGMTATGKSCTYDDEKCRYRAIIDLIYTDISGDEDYAVDVLVVRDYKTAWPTSEAELDTLQRKGQAVLAWKMSSDAYQVIRQEAVNLRTGASFTRDIALDDEGLELLAKWEREILMVCNAADRTREARPGGGCIGCPFCLQCEDCYDIASQDHMPTQYAQMMAMVSEMSKRLRGETKDKPYTIDGHYVGYRKQVKKVPAPNAHQYLAEIWTQDDAALPFVKGILQGEKLTAANIENVLKKLYPSRGANGKENMKMRETYLEDLLIDKLESRFGVWRNE